MLKPHNVMLENTGTIFPLEIFRSIIEVDTRDLCHHLSSIFAEKGLAKYSISAKKHETQYTRLHLLRKVLSSCDSRGFVQLSIIRFNLKAVVKPRR